MSAPLPLPQLAFVTGATGFVGGAVARYLQNKNIPLRLLVRPHSDRTNLIGLRAEMVEGTLADDKNLEKALQGVDVLFHVAADYRLWVPHPAAMYAANVDGTLNILRAAKRAGVGRIVYTSSVATLGYAKNNGALVDETAAPHLDHIIGHYKRSKFLAEEAVKKLIAEENIPAVIVNPSAPIGPGDIKPTPTGGMIVQAMHGGMPAYLNTGLNVVHADDCAAGHYLAYEKGVVGQRYILGGDNMDLKQILEIVAELTQQKAPTLSLSPSVLWPVAVGMEWVARLFPKFSPALTTDTLRMARHKMFYS
ncbi:MAG: NAD-dependent epimerase/dehydratase family protein, partial [Alphaproteobacteria bacterium]|nr:NAD-dependent epimerase/dehydratase family protein [Alphaproteobacteria bacterium]